jgi:mRNA-degrading endonuclease RelE of RelBE toxin-antitoxin system
MLNWRKSPPQDYLKYWRVVRYFIKAKYGLTQADLDILLFLYSEKYFSKDKFDEFDELISWDEDRFDKLLRDGWLNVFRKKVGNRRTVYELSYKARRVIGLVYKKLNGEELPEHPSVNPLFKNTASYMDKVYRNYIIEMNKFIRQQRHRSRE